MNACYKILDSKVTISLEFGGIFEVLRETFKVYYEYVRGSFND